MSHLCSRNLVPVMAGYEILEPGFIDGIELALAVYPEVISGIEKYSQTDQDGNNCSDGNGN